jgi:hypothetical protein
MMEVSNNQGEIVGYIWLTFVASTDEPILELHLCCHPEWQRRWLTKGVLCDGFGMILESRARHILAIHADPVYRKVLERLGFTALASMVHVLDTEDINYGIPSRYLWRGRG